MKHRKYRILSILLLACLALQVVIPGAWAEAAPEGWETLAPAETAAPEEGTDPAAAPEGPTDALEVTEEPLPLLRKRRSQRQRRSLQRRLNLRSRSPRSRTLWKGTPSRITGPGSL